MKGLHINFNVSKMTPMTALKILVGSVAPSLFFEEGIAKKLYPLKGMVNNQLLETGYMHLQATKPDTIGRLYSVGVRSIGCHHHNGLFRLSTV